MNKYSIYINGSYDAETRTYIGGTLDATFTNERDAFYREKELQWEHKKGVYMVCEGDERFKIVPCRGMGMNYAIVSKRNELQLYGACVTMEDAIREKAWCEKYHTEGGKWMDDYYKQFDAA